MRKAWLWGAFGCLFLGAVATGFVPDLRLAAERRAALAEGLLGPPAAPVPRERDAKRAFLQALYENKAAATRIRIHPESRGLEPNASTVRFLAATVAAARLPEADWSEDDPVALPESKPPPGVVVWTEEPDVFVVAAGEEIVARAKGESDLRKAAEVARLLDREGNLRAAQLWTGLANGILDRAQTLHVPPQRLAAVLGSPPEIPSLFRQRVHRVLARMERERVAGQMEIRVGKEKERAYIHAWRGLLWPKPADAQTLGNAVERTDPAFQEVFVPLPRTPSPPWTDWAADLERLRTRMAR